MRVVDRGRFAAAGVLFTAELFSGALEPLGAIATINRAAASHPDYVVPDPWPAFTYGPSQMAVSDTNDTRESSSSESRRWPARPASRRPSWSWSTGPGAASWSTCRVGRRASRRGGLPGRRRRQHLVPPRRGRRAHKLDNAASLEGLTLARASAEQVLPSPGLAAATAAPGEPRPVRLHPCFAAAPRRNRHRSRDRPLRPRRGRSGHRQPRPDRRLRGGVLRRVGARTFDRELQPVANATPLVLHQRRQESLGGIEVVPSAGTAPSRRRWPTPPTAT